MLLEEFEQSQPPSSPQQARLVGASRILQARRCIAQEKSMRGRMWKRRGKNKPNGVRGRCTTVFGGRRYGTHTITHKCGTGLPDGGACAFCLLPLSAMALPLSLPLPLPSCTVAFYLFFFVVVASFLCLSLSPFLCWTCL